MNLQVKIMLLGIIINIALAAMQITNQWVLASKRKEKENPNKNDDKAIDEKEIVKKDVPPRKRSVFWIGFGFAFLLYNSSYILWLILTPNIILTKFVVFGICVFFYFGMMSINILFDEFFPKK
jgi:hypothetical protein